MAKIVSGVGINDFGAKISNNGVHIRSYATWKSMLERCYNKLNTKRRPTYIGCSVCESWISFSNFKQWYDTNYITGFELDKDILIPGNKVYSPEAVDWYAETKKVIVKEQAVRAFMANSIDTDVYLALVRREF